MGQSLLTTFSELTLSNWILISLFLLLFLANLLVLILFYGRLALLRVSGEERLNPISLMMAIRNEEDNLKDYLPGLLKMGDEAYELVVIDDFSHDNSLLVLGALKREYSRLRFSALNQETRYSEKIARNIALKAASFEWVMMIPSTTVKSGAKRPGQYTYQSNPDISVAVGYSNVLSDKSFYNILYRIDSLFQQLRSFGSIISGMPYVAMEENVAFKKGSYFETGGFREKIAEPYVHLELIINLFIRKKSTQLLLSEESALYRKEQITRDGFLELQKKEVRLRSSLPAFKRWILGIIGWNYLLFPPMVGVVIAGIPALWPFMLALVVLFASGYALIMKKILHRLGEDKLFLPSLLLALILPYYKKVYQTGYYYHHRRRRWKEKK